MVQHFGGHARAALAAALLAPIGISGIMCIDLLTMSMAIFTLLPVAIPLVVREVKAGEEKSSLWSEIKFGFQYIAERKGLLYLLLLFLAMNLVTSIGNPLYAPFILSKTGNDSMALGTVMSFLGIGGVIGGVVMAVWGGPKRKVMGIYTVMIVEGALMMAFSLSSGLLTWCLFGFLLMMVSPMLMTCSQAIWQSKVAPEVQGRVFSTRRMIAQLATPVSLPRRLRSRTRKSARSPPRPAWRSLTELFQAPAKPLLTPLPSPALRFP